MGYHIYQESAKDYKKKKNFVKFGSITLNEHEAKFLQPKRELFRLKRALKVNEYLLLGCRKLVVETDAKYIHSMLNHPEMGPNATITRWIEKILMFHFELRHVPGKTFGLDGLSCREKQEGDEEYPEDECYIFTILYFYSTLLPLRLLNSLVPRTHGYTRSLYPDSFLYL